MQTTSAPADRTKVLCVDDEPRVVDGLALHLRRRYEVFLATRGVAALALLRQQPGISVIVSDMRMPEMDGAQFLSQARRVAPEAVRILLTGETDLASAVAAVNDGQLFRFLTKPCAPADLIKAIEDAAQQHRLITAERVLLEQTLHGSIKALADVLALTSPVAFGQAIRIKQHVADLAAQLGIRERWQAEVAAMLSQIGTIALPSDTAEKAYYGTPLTADEQKMVERIPLVTQQLLGDIPRLEVVRGIIAAYRTASPTPSLDGSDPQSALITQGAQLLRIAADFDALQTEGHAPAFALDVMMGRTERYEPTMLRAFAAMRGVQSQQTHIREVRLSAVKVGMVFAEDVRLLSGTLVAGRGYEVTASFVERAGNLRGRVASDIVRVIMPRPAASSTVA
jgi:response regulator RpfG family c-di-GMP phosphodiesterase